MKAEIWKEINGFKISNLGNVFCRKKRRLYKGTNGYYLIRIKNKTYSVHRLVAEAFLDNPQRKEQVNHKNGIKTDNRIENLEWCTRSENCKHAIKIGLINPLHKNRANGERCYASKLNSRQVKKIRDVYSLGRKSMRELGYAYGVSAVAIGHIIKRRNWKHV